MAPKLLIEGLALKELAQKVRGRIIGDPQALVYGLCPVEEPDPRCLAFTKLSSPNKIEAEFKDKQLAALLAKDATAFSHSHGRVNLLLVADPLAAIVALIPLFFNHYEPAHSISPRAEIDPSARIAANVAIGPFVTIGANVCIGENTVIHPQVTIYPGAQLGPDCVIHAGAVIREDCTLAAGCVIQNGAVIGADGFGYFPDAAGRLQAIPQVGRVDLAEAVEVGANSCIDRATLGRTRVGTRTKIDNLVQVGHNTTIGHDAILCGKVGVSGSCTIGNQVVLGGGAGVADHVSISDGCRVGAGSGVTRSLKSKGDYLGFPVQNRTKWHRSMRLLEDLPDIIRELKGDDAKEK